MIKLANGATVLMADLAIAYPGSDVVLGTVLAKYGEQFVTWRVRRESGSDTFDASGGNYFPTLSEATENYDARRIGSSAWLSVS